MFEFDDDEDDFIIPASSSKTPRKRQSPKSDSGLDSSLDSSYGEKWTYSEALDISRESYRAFLVVRKLFIHQLMTYPL